MNKVNQSQPPTEPRELAAWFAEGVRSEIQELERKGGEARYEVLSGRRLQGGTTVDPIFRFSLADAALVPEDSSGTLDVNGRQYAAKVLLQNGNQIDVQIEAGETLGEFIARAILRVDDVGLLRKLAEALDLVSGGQESVSPLCASFLHPLPEYVGTARLPSTTAPDEIDGEQRKVLEQAIASKVTYVWGPPGTGKTHLIAHLIAALVEQNERVLLASHTHVAVDEALYKSVRRTSEEEGPGPLAGSALEREGRIVRIGHARNPKVPASVCLDEIVKCRAEDIQCEIDMLHRAVKPLRANLASVQASLAHWQRLAEQQERLAQAKSLVDEVTVSRQNAFEQQETADAAIKERQRVVQQAKEAWFFRSRRIERATHELQRARQHAYEVAGKLAQAERELRNAVSAVSKSIHKVDALAEMCVNLESQHLLEAKLSHIEAEIRPLDTRMTELTARLDEIEKEVIASARVVAATLTKCYVGSELKDEKFDALIVDEISMALPPLLFVAARLAHRRMILVGDFKQLPPIVRSDSELSNARLRQDAFHLSGIVDDSDKIISDVLAQLRTQRRMLPPIADVARYISYGQNDLRDHDKVCAKYKNLLDEANSSWPPFLPRNALVIADTADVHCWCGRQAGSLSRFNFYSAVIACELAAMAAASRPRPQDGDVPKIGIITPYAAQRRILKRLIDGMKLESWVRVGTVHTFQGGEADLVIFDVVLDEPYYTARLCSGRAPAPKEVKRDLNVAVTRAGLKFVLLGSSEWLHAHAGRTSGLGRLWHYIKEEADLVSVRELLGGAFTSDVAAVSAEGYGIPDEDGSPVYQHLNETTFWPQFMLDLQEAQKSIVGLVPYFGQYRWPQIEPLIRDALNRGVEVTFITPPPKEAANRTYVEKAIRTLRELGAVVISATGFHPKDLIIDERIHYAGSLNWASHRGREELMHRFVNPAQAKLVLEYLQARHIRAATNQHGKPRTCPYCQGPVHIVNQLRLSRWDKQPIKIACTREQNPGCPGYIADIDQRAPFITPPRCNIDNRTKYRRVRRGRGETWVCPKHPKECERFKVVPGDVEEIGPSDVLFDCH